MALYVYQVDNKLLLYHVYYERVSRITAFYFERILRGEGYPNKR
jgi:hypothetical protein